MRLQVGAATDTGRVRDQNEDAFRLRADRGLFVVCDGMGGGPAGEVASVLAATWIVEHFERAEASATHGRAGVNGYLHQTSRLGDAVRRSNQYVYRQAQQNADQAEMGTTVVSAWLNDRIASVAHVGDSRAYLWHRGSIEALTRDHSLVEMQVGSGILDRDVSLRSEEQNVLVRALGREPDVEVDLTEVAVQPGDYLLLCTDGLTRMVPEQTLADAIAQLREPQKICDHLIGAANDRGGKDNVTVIVVHLPLSWWRRTLSQWTSA
jgi:protein phosphatase